MIQQQNEFSGLTFDEEGRMRCSKCNITALKFKTHYQSDGYYFTSYTCKCGNVITVKTKLTDQTEGEK